jgi:hypothetical protein
MSVHKKLMQARIKLQGMKLSMSGENKFAGYKYFKLEDFLPQVQQIFHDLGLCSVVTFDGSFAKLDIIDTDDGTMITMTSPMADAQLKGAHAIQNLGAVESYQRRYLWLAAMEIVEHDVLDATMSQDAPKAKPKAEVIPDVKPTGQAPAKIEGKEGPWQLKITAKKEEDLTAWIDVVVSATKIALENTASLKDVMDIFKVNRNIFDVLKNEAPEDYTHLMEEFSKRKQAFPAAKKESA